MDTELTKNIKAALHDLIIPEKAAFLPKFFKTGKGEYGEGDLFLGVIVPDQKAVAKEYYAKITFEELGILISSPYHEHRLTALLMLVFKFEKTKNESLHHEIVYFYLSHLQHINNWDLVDTSCYKILGAYAFNYKKNNLLQPLAHADSLWEKRIAVVATLYFIKKDEFELTKNLVKLNLNHPHDLMHKANGWMLREMGKRNENELIKFLDIYAKNMPRTCLRYAIEKLDENIRKEYLKL